jgi:osmotically-inducible protein OsmY
VLRQLEWDPEVDAAAVGVAASHGAVTLTGFIDTYAGKLAAERAAKRVHGVRAVANELEVRLKIARTDADIAADAVRALELRATIPPGVQASVRHGQVTLTGTAGSVFQRHQAEEAIRHIRGVRDVLNHIAVAPRSVVRDVRRSIVHALHQNADLDALKLSVVVDGDTARLSGSVSTWLQRESAEQAAAHVPGIARVDNQIVVEPVSRAALDLADDVC